MDYLQYSLKPDLKRMVIPQIIKLIVLSAIFYFGVVLNLRIMNVDAPGYVSMLVIVVLSLLIVLQTILTFVKGSRLEYKFYQDRIEADKNKIYYNQIDSMRLRQNFFDKLFDTKTIILGKFFKIGAITNYNEVYAYIEQLVESIRGYFY